MVAHSICTTCEDSPVTSESTCNNCGSRCMICDKFNKDENEFERYPCVGCGKRQMIFKGPNTQEEFCKWLISTQHTDFTVIAHNVGVMIPTLSMTTSLLTHIPQTLLYSVVLRLCT